jgi:hypothetical protein
MLLMNMISLMIFTFLLGFPVAHPFLFVCISCFGACSISLVFSFLAAIAARAQQNAALMAILGFPLIIPQLMLMMRLSTIVFSDVIQNGLVSIVLLLASFDIVIIDLISIPLERLKSSMGVWEYGSIIQLSLPQALSVKHILGFDRLVLFLPAGNNRSRFLKFTICFVRTGGKY